jgi:hypothetical protein
VNTTEGRRTVVVALAVAAFSLTAAVPASAHADHFIYTPAAYGRAMYQSGDLLFCNDQWGGTYVVVHFRNIPFGPVHHTGRSYGGCIRERHPDVYEFRVCGSADACSAWHSRI